MNGSLTTSKRRAPPSQLHRGQQFNSSKSSQASISQIAPPNAATPYLVLLPLNDTFELKTIQLPFLPDVVKVGRQTNKSTWPSKDNGYFDSKVLSRSHAEIWATADGKVCIKDIRSSNGTFINGIRLSKENEESEVKEILPGDTLELGIDILNDDSGTIIHRKVSARVDHAGFPIENSVQNGDSGKGQLVLSNASHGPVAPQSLTNRALYDGNNYGSNASLSSMASGQTHMPGGRHTVTIDMVIKKLSNDLQMSKQVGVHLKQASEIFATGGTRSKSLERHLRSPFSKVPSPQHSVQSPISERLENVPAGEVNGETAPAQGSHRDDPSALSEQLESAKWDLEVQRVRLEELESNLMAEREARMQIEEKWRTMLETSVREVDDDASSVVSSDTITKDYTIEHDHIPIGMDEVSESNGGGVIERLENLLRNAQNDINSWKARAETAENENITKSSKILELIAELERSKESGKAGKQQELSSLTDKPEHASKRTVRNDDSVITGKNGRGTALVSMVGVLMLGLGLMSFLNDYGPKKD